MSGFASFATGNPSFCRSPPAHASQPLRTSPLKSSYIPASRNASPTPSSSSRDDGGRDDESDVGSTSHSGSDSGDEDLVFFGTPTSAEARSIARLSQAIPATPLPSTPSKRQKVVRKRDSREFLRRQTILHQPYNGCTPVKGAQQKQEEKAGRKVWPGGFFERPLAQREDEEETDFAPTPARFGRRKTPSPTRRHEDDGLALDFGRMGLASPAVAAPEARRARRSSSLASTTSSDRSEEVLGMDVFEGCLSTDDELADSDKENCPGPDEAHSAITEQSEEGSADLFDGPVSEVLFPENSLNAANYIRELDMGSLNLTDFGDEDTGNVIESDDGHLSDSSAESSSPVRLSLGFTDQVVDSPEGLEHRFEEESRREEENEGNAEHDREESIVSPSSPARLSIERKEEDVEGKDVAEVRIEEQSRREGGNEENAERDREESSVSPSSPARLSERLSETRGEGVEGNEVTALRIEEEDQAEEGSRFPDEETDAVIEEEADPLDQTTAREEVAIDTTSSTQEAAEDDKVASPEPDFGTRVREGEEDEGAAPDDDGRAAADLSDDDAADLLEDASAPSGAEHHVHDFEADVSSNDDMDVGDVSMVDIEAVSKAVRAPETDDLDQMVPSTITAAELSSEQSSAASSSSSVIGQGEADGTSLLTPQSPFLPALTMSPGVLFQSCMSHLASSTSSSSPTTSTTSSTYSSPIPLARAAPPGVLQIPVIMPSPTRDASSSPSRAQDVDNAGLHHFAPSLLDHFGTPSAATSRAYSTPDSIRASNAANRPIRTPVPLQASSATGPSTPTLRNSTLPTRTNAPTRAPGQAISKLARKAAITSSASGSRSGTAPDTVAKVNAQLSTRKITPEDDAVRLAALAAERERAALASVRKPLPAKSVEASQPLGAQMQRGKLNMGPPARPGSALSNSSSGSSGKGAGSGRSAGARSSDKDSASSVSARLGGVTGASARGPGARIGTGIPRPPSATQRSTATGAVSSSSSASSSGPSRSSVARPAMTSVPKMSGPKVTSITKPVINTRTILGTRDLSQSSRTPAPSASSQTFKTTTRTVLPSRVPAQSGPTSRSVIRPNAIAASSVSAPAASARTSPSKANPLKRQRPHAAPPVARSMVQVEAGVSHGSAVQTHGTQMGMRSALSGLGPAVRRVGGRLVPSAPTREKVSALQAVEDDLTPVVADPWQGPVFDSGGYAQQLYHPGLAPVPSPARFGGIGRTGVGARAGSSSARNRMPGTPSRMGSAATPQRSQLHRTAMAGQGLISALAPAHFDGPRHFDAIPIDSDAPPAANTRLHPEDSHGQDAPSSSPPAEVRGSSEDHAEVSFMIPAAASSSEVGSSPIKQSDKAPSPPDNSTSNEEKTPSPPVTRSSSQSPSKPPKRNTTRPARATSAPATKSALSRPAVRAGQSIVPDMTEKELKSKTALNTAKNEKRVCAIDRQVINIDAPRPPSPTSKIPTTAAREEREKKMGRDERARRRKADEEEAKAGEEALVRREERVRGPGDEEGWIYEDEDRDDGQDELSDPYGPPRKRVKMGHGDREKKRVKWDKGVVVIRDFGEGLGRIRSASASASASGEGASLKSAMSLERRIELDQFGNVLPSRSTFTAKPHKVVVQAIFYQGEEPYVAPAQATRGKKKAAA